MSGAPIPYALDHLPDQRRAGTPPSGLCADTDELGRVKLGASRETPPDILVSLATDASVTVRAAVAMNEAAPPHTHTLLAADGDERVRTLLARKLSALLPSLAGADRDRLYDQALTTLGALVTDEALRVRAAIADVVKEMTNVPRDLILRLAQDSAIPVSEPVIRLSPMLTAEDLLGLLETPASPATATAIARRPRLQPSVCDAIARQSDAEAIKALLENPSAAIREATLDALIARATDHEPWHGPLVRRPHLTARAARALSQFVATELLDTLAGRADLNQAVTLELRKRLAERMQPITPTTPPLNTLTLDQAMAEARVLDEECQLTERSLLEAAGRGEPLLACAMLAVAAEVPARVVEHAVTLRSAKGLVSLVWKAGYSMRAAVPLQTLLTNLAPNTILRPVGASGFPLSIEEMRWQIDFLARLGNQA